MMPGNSKEAYNTLKVLKKAQQLESAVLKDSSGNIGIASMQWPIQLRIPSRH